MNETTGRSWKDMLPPALLREAEPVTIDVEFVEPSPGPFPVVGISKTIGGRWELEVQVGDGIMTMTLDGDPDGWSPYIGMPVSVTFEP